jgi:hypothetical protein
MTAPVPALPQRPADLAGDHTLADLVDAYARHVPVLAAARTGGQPVPAVRLAAHAVAALAIGRAITDDLCGERAVIVRDALAHGAGYDQVAAACATVNGGAPVPLNREPLSIRAPWTARDDRFDSLQLADPEGWRRAVHLDRVAAQLEPLAGLNLSKREHAAVAWLAGWDIPTVAALVSLLHRARAAQPFDGAEAGR